MPKGQKNGEVKRMYEFDHQPQYPVDLIAQRDEKLKISSSVIKSWNVRFVDAEGDFPEEDIAENVGGDFQNDTSAETVAEPELTPEQEEAIRSANEIFARLEAEKAADEAAKQAEIEAALAAQDDSNYNASTNSYSGAYGTGPVSEETAAQAASILAEKKDAMADLISDIQKGS